MANVVAESQALCSVCREEASEASDRTVVRLRCSHLFHLDCIGSAFNASGSMICPNCRGVENGTWRRFENDNMEEEDDDDEDDEDFYDVDDDLLLGMQPRDDVSPHIAVIMRNVLLHSYQKFLNDQLSLFTGNHEPIAHGGILDPQSFRPPICPGFLVNSGSINGNFQWIQQSSNGLSPAARYISAGRIASSALLGSCPPVNPVVCFEQTRIFNHASLSGISLQSDPQPAILRHNIQESYDNRPPAYWPDYRDPI